MDLKIKERDYLSFDRKEYYEIVDSDVDGLPLTVARIPYLKILQKGKTCPDYLARLFEKSPELLKFCNTYQMPESLRKIIKDTIDYIENDEPEEMVRICVLPGDSFPNVDGMVIHKVPRKEAVKWGLYEKP